MALDETDADRGDAARKRATALEIGSSAPSSGASTGAAALASAAGLIEASDASASNGDGTVSSGDGPRSGTDATETSAESAAPPSVAASAASPAAQSSQVAPAAATVGGHADADVQTSAGGAPAPSASPAPAWSAASLGPALSAFASYLAAGQPLVDQTSSDSATAGGSGDAGSIDISAGPSSSGGATSVLGGYGFGGLGYTSSAQYSFGSMSTASLSSSPTFSTSAAFAQDAAARLAAFDAARDQAESSTPAYTPPTLDDRLAEALQKLTLGGGATTIVNERSASSEKAGGDPDARSDIEISTIPDQGAFLSALNGFLEENGMSGFHTPLSALGGSGSIFDNLIAEDRAPLSLELSGGAAAIGDQAHTAGEVSTTGSSGFSADAIKGVAKFTASADGHDAQVNADSGASVSGADFIFVVQYDAAFGSGESDAVSATRVMAINYAGFDLASGPVVMAQTVAPSLSTTGLVNQLAPGVGLGRNGPDYEHNQGGVAFNSTVIDPLDMSEAVLGADGSSLATEFASLSTGTSSVEIFY